MRDSVPQMIEIFLSQHNHEGGLANIVMTEWKIGTIKHDRKGGRPVLGYIMANCLLCLSSKLVWDLE